MHKYNSIAWLFFLLTLTSSAKVQKPDAVLAKSTAISEQFDANNITCWMTNDGKIVDYAVTGDPGMEWPKGSAKTIDFCSGLWLVGKTPDGELRSACTEYSSEFRPGNILPNGQAADPENPLFRIYKINSDGTGDWDDWPFDLGAPALQSKDGSDSLDVNGFKIPQLFGDQTLWWVMNDADKVQHAMLFETKPFGVEARILAFGFDDMGPLSDVLFYQWELLNKSNIDYDSCFVGLWDDPDVGDAADDLVGCDRELNVGYCYNGFSADNSYLGSPPCIGFQLLKGPLVNDTPLPMTSFVFFWGAAPAPWGDPDYVSEAFNFLKGFMSDGTSYVDNEGKSTKFLFDGDPVTDTGFVDNYPADRRFLLGCGPFSLAVGEKQTILAAKVIGNGETNLTSIIDMKNSCRLLQHFAPFLFKPACFSNPIVELYARTDEKGIELSWDDVKKQYQNISSHVLGYKVWQLGPTSERRAIASYDEIDGITTIMDVIDGVETVVYEGKENGLDTRVSVINDAWDHTPFQFGREYTFLLQAFVYHPFAAAGQKVKTNELLPKTITYVPGDYSTSYPARHIQGEGKGSVTMVITRPQQLNGHQYLVSFRRDDVMKVVLEDATAGQIIFDKEFYNRAFPCHLDSLGYTLYIENNADIKSIATDGDPWFQPYNSPNMPWLQQQCTEGICLSGWSIAEPWRYFPLRIDFQDNASVTRDGYWSEGYGEVRGYGEYFEDAAHMPLAAFDMLDPTHRRKLNLYLRENGDFGEPNGIWDLGWNGNSFVDSVGAREFVYILDSTYGEDEDYEYDPFGALMDKTLYYIRMAGKPDRSFLDQSVSIYIEPDPGLTEADVFRFWAQVTDVDERLTVAPMVFQLHPNYPNPFNALTTFDYDVMRQSHIHIGIYDILGRNVASLVNERKEPGHYRVFWDASHHATGVYIAVMRAGESLVMTRKMLLLK